MKGNYLLIGIIIAFVVTMAMTQGVSAASMDLDVYPVSTSACPCSTVSEMRVFVTNLGSVSDTYELSLVLPDGWPKGFIGTYQGGHLLTLGPGEESTEGDITLYITPSCDAQIGDNVAKVVAVNKRTGETVEKTFMVSILKCRGVAISASNIDMCEGVGKAYDFSILNEGKVDEVFDVSVTSEWGELTKQTVVLEPNQIQDITLNLNIPAKYTDLQKMTISVESQTSYATAEREVEMNVMNCYVFDAYLTDNEKTSCLGDESIFTLIVENNGLETDTFNIYSEDDVELDKSKVVVAPGSKEVVQIITNSTEEETRDFAVIVSSEFDPVAVKTIVGTLNARECKGVELEPGADGNETIKEVCFGLSATFDVLVKNTGTIPAVFRLTSDAGVLSQNRVVLEPGESKKVTLIIDTGSEMDIGSTKTITVRAVSDNVVGEYEFELTAKDCYGATLEITSDDDERQICVCDNVDYTVTVKNTGELKDIYELKFLDEIKVFELAPGEEKSYDYVYGTLGKEPELKVFKLTLNSPFVSIEKDVKLNVEPLEACFGVDITVNGANILDAESQVIENTRKVEVCEGVTFSLNVKNRGSKADTFEIVTNGPEWVFLSEDKIILDPGEEREVYVYAAPEFETDLGVYTIEVNVTSPKNASDTVGLVVNVLEKGTEEEPIVPDANATDGNETVGDDSNETSNITMNMTIPTGAFRLADVSARAMIIGLIALAIIAILVIRFFVK